MACPPLSSAADRGEARVVLDLDELAGHGTPLDDERELVAGKPCRVLAPGCRTMSLA